MSGPGQLPQLEVNDDLYSNSFNNIRVGKSRVFGAAIHEAFLDNPTVASFRIEEQSRAGGRPSPGFKGTTEALLNPAVASVVNKYLNRGREKERISEQDFNSNYAQIGLRWNPQMTHEEAAILYDRKRREMRNMEIMRRGRGGAIETIGKFGSALIASLLDPVNVAVSFIPVVGEARWARWAQKYGATRTRITAGAIEGAVGQATVEPLAFSARTQEQADYTATDAFYNVMIGTALGSGLHVIGGKAKDIIAKQRAAVDGNLKATDTAMRQMIENKRPDVEALNLATEAEMTVADRSVSTKVSKEAQLREARTSLDLDEIVAGHLPKHTVKKVGKGRNRYHASFDEEAGTFKGTVGRGKSEAEAVQDLVQLYSSIREEVPFKTQNYDTVNQLKSDLTELVNKRNKLQRAKIDPEEYNRRLREKGVPVDVMEGYRQRLAERKVQRSEISGNKINKKLRLFDQETAEIEAEFDQIKKLNVGNAHKEVQAGITRELSTLDAEIRKLKGQIDLEAESLARKTVEAQRGTRSDYLEASDELPVVENRAEKLGAQEHVDIDTQDALEELKVYDLTEAEKQVLASADEDINLSKKKGDALIKNLDCVIGALNASV